MMDPATQRFRWLSTRLPRESSQRLVVLTGARQTGKTTLVKSAFGDLRYLNLDDMEVRSQLRTVRAENWHKVVGPAVLDEAQKEPTVFEKVKFAFDDHRIRFSVLLGSSRFLLLDNVRETLAGRSFLYELWPLMPSELRCPHDATPDRPLLDQLIDAKLAFRDILADEPEVLLGADDSERRDAIEHLARWGGMPELLRLDDDDRKEWLRSYQQTFLERDLSDLARLSELEPFRNLQRLCMLRTGGILSFSELGRDAAISASTARRYLEYLRISYQAFLLPPFSTNLTSMVVKTPKLYWTDLGTLRQATLNVGPLDGLLFETLVVAEVRKWVATMGKDVELSFYRTRSGLEVDLLLRTAHGIFGIEIKSRQRVDRKDQSAMKKVADRLGDQWRGGLVVYRGGRLELLNEEYGLFAVPVHRLF